MGAVPWRRALAAVVLAAAVVIGAAPAGAMQGLAAAGLRLPGHHDGRGLQLSTFWLNLSALCGIGCT